MLYYNLLVLMIPSGFGKFHQHSALLSQVCPAILFLQVHFPSSRAQTLSTDPSKLHSQPEKLLNNEFGGRDLESNIDFKN